MDDVKTWKFAVTTPKGIFNGTLEGQMEEGETNGHAMQVLCDVVKNYLREIGVKNIMACFVSDSELHIDAPNTELIPLNIEEDLQF